MNPWFFPWWGLFEGPLSGDVTQDISPVTSWFSPQLELHFAGDRRIEAEVVADVASYGRQLGILSEAVLELAGGKKGDAVARLQELAAKIEAVKERHSDALEQSVKSDLERLKQQDPEALARLLGEYR
ncbi:MAG: hypothetical protein OEM67_10510 [Thermoleophilia bacterium]|nr:hypothetical protein [Thermoleophilia bacterium]